MVAVDRETFDRIKQKHGAHASWAVWAEPGDTPKSNVSDLSVLDPDHNPMLLDSLRPNVVMLGLNISRPFAEAFRNFHDPSPSAQDFKIRFAFTGSPFYGAYMTDIIKDVVMVDSGDLLRHLRENPSLAHENIERLLGAFQDLGYLAPTVIAFGGDVHRLAAKLLPRSRLGRLVRVTHYSRYMSQEAYRGAVLAELNN